MTFVMNTVPVTKSVDKMKFFSARNKIKSNEQLSKDEIEVVLDFYVGECRRALEKGLGININTDPLTNRCDLAQKLIGAALEQAGVIVYPQETHKTIHPEVPGHSFLIAIFNNDEPYLIDLTYRQFFLKENCDVERLKVYEDSIILAPHPGFFASSKKEMMATAHTILERGYVPLTDEHAKHYGDSFYFAKTGRGGYSDISGSVYKNAFLKENHVYSLTEQSLKNSGFRL